MQNIKIKLQTQFEQIENIWWEESSQVDILHIETNLIDLKDIQKLSQAISKYLDEIDFGNKKYILDVYSKS